MALVLGGTVSMVKQPKDHGYSKYLRIKIIKVGTCQPFYIFV
jgi:hypothetical protein